MQRLSKALKVPSGLQSPAYWELYCKVVTLEAVEFKDGVEWHFF